MRLESTLDSLNELPSSIRLQNKISLKLNDLSMNDLTPIISWMKSFLKSGRTLVYLASGTHINHDYKSLPYENVILVDYSFKECSYDGDKIVTLSLDALLAISVLKTLNVKIDCLVCVNEWPLRRRGKIFD